MKVRYEDRPPETDMPARILWDIFKTVKRINWLEYDDDWEHWCIEHSTGDYSHYYPETGDWDFRNGSMKFSGVMWIKGGWRGE